MKRILIITLAVIVCISSLIFVMIKFDIPERATKLFWKKISFELSREGTERFAKACYDTDVLCLWEDGTFFISEYRGDKMLSIVITVGEYGNSELDKVFIGVTEYKKKNGKFYVIADEGYAVIDKNNICRAFIIEECESYRRDKYIEDDLVIYLETKDDFSKEERAIFDKMDRWIAKGEKLWKKQ